MKTDQLIEALSCLQFAISKKTKNSRNHQSILKSLGVLVLALLLPLGVFAQFGTDPLPQIALDNVPEASDFDILYKVNMPENAVWTNGVPYAIDYSGESIDCFDKVAYFMRLERASGQIKWVWVSMDAFTTDLVKLGLPQKDVPETNFTHQQLVNDMSYYYDAGNGIVSATGVSTGNIEIWNTGYTTGNGENIPNASDATYDWGDTIADDSYSSFQIHDHGAEEVVLAYNGWGKDFNSGASDDVGITNNYLGVDPVPDWTFRSNANDYVNRMLFVMVSSSSETPECTLIATKEIHLHDNNNVISGNVCVTANNGKVKLHKNSNVDEVVNAAEVQIDNNSSAGTVIEAPANVEIPMFYYNTVSNGDSPNVTVNNNETVVLDGQIYGKVEIKDGASVTFTASNIFINELKTKKHTQIRFADCANILINKKVKFDEYTDFNPDMNNVSMYVDDKVEVKKGSTITAYIHANDNEIKVQGDRNKPVYMKGQFIAKKIHGKKFVTWEGNAYCAPCEIEIPETEATCECKGGMSSVTFEYAGGGTLSTNSGTIADNGDGTYTVSDNGEKLEKNLEIYVDGNTAEIHTSCSRDIIGVTFVGSITVIEHVDVSGNVTSLELCPPVVDCECKGGMTSLTFSYMGGDALSTNSGTIADNGDGTYTITDNGAKLEKNLEVYSGNNTAEIHTSCSRDVIGVTFSGGVTVIAYTDTKGNTTTVDGCSQEEVEGPDCECKGGLTSITFSYGGAESLSTNSGTIVDNGDGTFTITDNGAKLEKNLEVYSGGNTAEIHTSCSRDILGVTFSGDITVIGYVDSEGSVSSIDTCPSTPVECDCKGGLVEVTFSYAGTYTPSTNSGSVTNNGDGTYTITDNGVKLEKNLEIYVGSSTAEVHTSCSRDILGVTFAGGVTVVKHVDKDGNVCQIDSGTSRTANANRGAGDRSEDEITDVRDELNVTGFNVKTWPIPSDNAFNIKVATDNNRDRISIQVLDISGKTVHMDTFDANSIYKFGEKLQSGIYFVKLNQAGNQEIKRVVKY